MPQDGVGQIPPQGGLQAGRGETSAREGQLVDIPPSGVLNAGDITAGGGNLCLLPT